MIFSRLFEKPIVPSEQEASELKMACENIAATLRAAGHATPAFSASPRPYARDFKNRLVHLKIFEELICGPNPKSHKDLMWRYFGKMKFTPPSDFLELLEDEDIIEVYDMNHEQIFRNLNYFEVVSFSVEDLISINWKRDFKRSAKVTIQLVELVFRFATGMFSKTFDCSKVPLHNVEELLAKRNRIELALKYIIPLKQNGKCAAIMAISRARVLT